MGDRSRAKQWFFQGVQKYRDGNSAFHLAQMVLKDATLELAELAELAGMPEGGQRRLEGRRQPLPQQGEAEQIQAQAQAQSHSHSQSQSQSHSQPATQTQIKTRSQPENRTQARAQTRAQRRWAAIARKAEVEAVELFEFAAREEGHPMAMYNLGVAHLLGYAGDDGQEGEENLDIAAEWFKACGERREPDTIS